MLLNVLLSVFGRYDYRYDIDEDGPGSTSIWLNLCVLSLILCSVWWNKSQRIQNHFGKNFSISSSNLAFVFKTLLFDIKEHPLNFFACIGIMVVYFLVWTYKWFFYVCLGLGVLGAIIYMKWRNGKDE